MKLVTINKPINEQKDFIKLVETGDYFNEMDSAIQNSPTATMAVLMFKKYCKLENLKHEYEELWNKIVDEKIKYGFFTLWLSYDIDLNIKDIFFRQSKNYRAKKQDDTGKSSAYLNVATKKEFPAFNNNKIILTNQIQKAGGFKKFCGQIYQYNTTSTPYEISPFFSVFNWMKVEFDTPNHVSASADNSLFGNNLFIMKKSADSSNDADGNPIVTNTDRVIGALRKGKGAVNSGSNFVLETDTDEDLTKIITKIAIGNEIDVDKFNLVDDKAGKKICTACYCFPQILASPSEGLFGNSGDAYKTAIQFWRETCEFEAKKIQTEIEKIGINLTNEITPPAV